MDKTKSPPRHYTQSVLLQMLAVFSLLGGVVAWQWDVVSLIYLKNQINALGWAINGSILLLFLGGLAVLIRRFLEYRMQESAISRFLRNIKRDEEPLAGVSSRTMVAERYRILREINRQRAVVNQNALAATLLAAESSRNSFLKFVHNVLILTGVFGTIISLSLSLLGASDIIQGSGQAAGQASGLSTMIFGMSTALSTTMTAILAYLVFGYFYIKLTDTQTYLISRVEEATTTVLLPDMQPDRDAVVKDYADSIRSAGKLIEHFDQSQRQYDDSIQTLLEATQSLSRQMNAHDGSAEARLAGMLAQVSEQQQRAAAENRELLSAVVDLLQEGFRLPK